MALPEDLRALYGGDLALGPDAVYANFVSSLDGVVALETAHPSAGPLISDHSQEDRMVMGILRAYADAVVVGAGTLRAEKGHVWTPAHIHPPLSSAYAQMRHSLGRDADPLLVVVTAGGNVNPHHPAIQKGALVITTPDAASVLRARLPIAVEVIGLGSAPISAADIVSELRSRGHRRILTEGGPHLMAAFVAGEALSDLFLTVSPVIAGRADEPRPGFVAGAAFLPDRQVRPRLTGVRCAGSHLFTQYDLRREG